jgi:hypothetical protein
LSLCCFSVASTGSAEVTGNIIMKSFKVERKNAAHHCAA